MAISWSSWEGSTRQVRVGIEVDWTAANGTNITHNTDAAKATVKYYVAVRNGSFSGDHQTLHFSGWIDGTYSDHNYQSGGDGAVLWATRSQNYSYGANEYGSSPGNRNFGVRMSGAGNGSITPSITITEKIPARPIAEPLIPNEVSVVRINDGSQKVTWNNRGSSARPWAGINIDRQTGAGSWERVANPGGSATSYTDSSTEPNRRYRYRVRAHNNAGYSDWSSETGYVNTTPPVPTNVKRTTSGANQVITWANNVWVSNYSHEVWRAEDGVWETSPLGVVQEGVFTFTDVAPDPAKAQKYRVRAKTDEDSPTLYSAFSAETDESLGMTSPPLSPVVTEPKDVLIVPTTNNTFRWTHRPTDTTAQTSYVIRYREAGTTTWTTLPRVYSSVGAHVMASGTFVVDTEYEWQVKTAGADPLDSPWSSVINFGTATDPAQVRQSRVPVMLNLDNGELETTRTGVLPPVGSMMMYAGETAPSGWAICDGTTLSQTQHPDLFAILGTRYNTGGEPAGHFRLPNMLQRFPVGANPNVGTFHLGTRAGSSSATLTESNLPQHSHGSGSLTTSNDGNHDHALQYTNTDSGNAGSVVRGASPDGSWRTPVGADGAHSHNVTGQTAVAGQGTSFSVMNPYVAVNFIIKT